MASSQLSGNPLLHVLPDAESVARAAAEVFVTRSIEAIARSGRFTVVLSGGSTPKQAYEILAQPPFKNQVDWSLVHVFWGDERCVEPIDHRSNYGMAHQALLSHVPIPRAQIHPMFCKPTPEDSAREYEQVLRQYFAGQLAVFDMVFLGVGEDGHTASLLPGSAALQETVRWVTTVQKEAEDFCRLSLSVSALNSTRLALFLATGPGKAVILQKILKDGKNRPPFPAQLIRPAGELIWLIDSAAHELMKT